jgi:uncharacterized protein
VREVQARLEEAPDASELKALLNENEVAFSRDTRNLGSFVELMDNLELDTSAYKRTLLQSGQISGKTVDRNVLLALVQEWGETLKAWLSENVPQLLVKLLVSVLIVAVFWGLAGLTRRLVELFVSRMDLFQLLERMLLSTVSKAVILLGILVAFTEIGVQLAPLLAGLGIAGFIVGFALQDSLSNFAYGGAHDGTGAGRHLGSGPAFDCSKATGEVEKLICQTEELAALDRRLDEVCEAAMAKARDDMPQMLRVEQRGWIKGRNHCWKAQGASNPVFLTASWKATDVRECVEGNYRLRISELQARWQLVSTKGPVFYACENNPANEVVATFNETDPPVVVLERGDQSMLAWLVPAASGSKYEGRNVTFWTKGDEAVFTWFEDEIQCRVRPQ